MTQLKSNREAPPTPRSPVVAGNVLSGMSTGQLAIRTGWASSGYTTSVAVILNHSAMLEQVAGSLLLDWLRFRFGIVIALGTDQSPSDPLRQSRLRSKKASILNSVSSVVKSVAADRAWHSQSFLCSHHRRAVCMIAGAQVTRHRCALLSSTW
jgi:hypothetical protein